MKILFFMRFYSYIAHYEEVLKQLTDAGHEVHFAFNKLPRKPFDAKRMKRAFPLQNISYDFFPDLSQGGMLTRWTHFNRRLIDYIRYLHPDYKVAEKLRRRAAKSIPNFWQFVFSKILTRLLPVGFWIGCLKWLDGFFPIPEKAKLYLQGVDPDLVLFTPLLDSNTGFIDYAKAAKNMGIKTAICVASWDNLTNKGIIQVETDKVFVWNRFQQAELEKYHKISPDKIELTGAQTFDKWFSRKPIFSKEAFMQRIGLGESRDFIVYLCSSGFIAKKELGFIRKWVSDIRSRSEFDEVGIMIRPHPANPQKWEDLELLDQRQVVVYPQWEGIPYPFTEEDRSDYFHSLRDAAAVVGVNTSAMIEAGIQSTPVFTILADEFKETQEGTLHFFHIKDHGLLSIAENLGEHSQQLFEVMQSPNVHQRIQAFIGDFIRPNGLNRACSPIFAQKIESMV